MVKLTTSLLSILSFLILIQSKSFALEQKTTGNLINDHNFEEGISTFRIEMGGDLARSSISPLEGKTSLKVQFSSTDSELWWSRSIERYRQRGETIMVSGILQNTSDMPVKLRFCAGIYYSDWNLISKCATLNLVSGQKVSPSISLSLDSNQQLEMVGLFVDNDSNTDLSFLLDKSSVVLIYLDYQQPPPAEVPSQN